MITVQTIRGKMDEHILGARLGGLGARDRCALLGVDDDPIVEFLAIRYGDLAPVMLGIMVIGIEIGKEIAAVNDDREPTANRDEFLESLPEADPGYLEST